MQKPESPMGSLLSPNWKRRRWPIVCSAQQLQELETFFKSNHYPTPKEGETLAARLNVKEHQVHSWFRNRRAKDVRLLGLHSHQGPGAGPEPQGPGVCVPAPAPAGPEFPRGPGFCSPPPHSLLADPSVSSHSHIWWIPVQGAQSTVPVAPAPAGATEHLPCCDPWIHELYSPKTPWRDPPPPPPGYTEEDDFVD